MSPKASLRRHERGRLTQEGGQALIEFALLLPVLLLLIFGVIDFGKALGYKNDETHLANQAARYVAVNSCTACGADTIEHWIPTQAETDELKAGLAVPGHVKIAFADTAGKFPDEAGYNGGSLPAKNHCQGQAAKVSMTYQYHFLGLDFLPITLHSSSTMRLEANWGSPTGQFRLNTDKYQINPTASASPDSCA